MTPKTLFSLVLAFILIILVLSSAYTIQQGDQAIVLRLGKIERNAAGEAILIKPGLHFKIPLINSLRIFDVRLQTLDVDSSRIVTAEKKDVLVDYYAKWKITNLPKYLTSTGGDKQQAEMLLEQQLNDSLRAEFGKRTIKEVVSDDRSEIMKTLRINSNATAEKLGISVMDVRIKRIDLPAVVSTAVYDRMRAERKRVATKHRADGRAKAEAIHAKADADATVIVAKAKFGAAKTRALGEEEAASIYSKAYDQNPEFYAFYRSLLAYKRAFNHKNDVLVLSPNSQFFKYFNSATGKTVSK